MPVVRAGSLRTPLVLERWVPAPDGMGGDDGKWTVVTAKPIRARVRGLSAEERMHAMQTQARVTHEITIRFRPDLVGADTENLRFVKGNCVFNIRGVIDEEYRKWRMKIRAEEGVLT